MYSYLCQESHKVCILRPNQIFLPNVVNICMHSMLIDYHQFAYQARVPWPQPQEPQVNWIYGIETIEYWLRHNVGSRWCNWAWCDSDQAQRVGVAFRRQQDCCLFILTWDR